jgi:flagellin
MTLSVNTNNAAMTALQYLNKTNAKMEKTETAIATGQTVASAKDNGAVYAIAQNMRGEVSGYGAVETSLNTGMSVLDTATSAGESVSDLLIQMKEIALEAADTSLDSASRSALNEDFTALRDQITTVVNNASFNGVNMLNGTQSSSGISALASTDGTKISVATSSWSLGGTVMGSLGASTSIDGSASAALTAVDSVTTALENVDSKLATLSAGSKRFSVQLTFVQSLSDTLTSGIGNLVDADMSEESANLTSLQTKQQLGVQALSIANSSSSIVLSLFQ